MIHNRDCGEGMKRLPDNCIDLTVTSPPYDNLREYGGFLFDIQEIATQLYRVTKDGGVVVWIVGDQMINGGESGTSFRQAITFMDAGFRLHDTMIWNKGSFTFPSKTRYHQVFDYMFVFSKGEPKTVHLIKDRRNLYLGKRGASGRGADGTRNQGKSEVTEEYGARFNVWNIPVGRGHSTNDEIAFQHPAIFPERIAQDHILTWTNKGDTVMDIFSGSGTTHKMAYKHHRRFIGFEINREYVNIEKQRIDEATRQLCFF